MLEIGNEPHNSGFAKALGGAWNGRAPSPWVDHYVRMVDAAVRAVKDFDASIRLLTDDDLWVVRYWYLQAGLPRALDGFAVHPYTPGPPERTAVAHDTDWTRPFRVVDPDRSFGSAVRLLREQARGRLDCTPSIWITEWGWAVDAGSVAKAVPEPTLMATGLPCVAWNTAAHSTLLAHESSGLLCDSEDGLLECIAELVDSAELRARLGDAAREEALTRFSRDGRSEALIESYRTAAAQRAASSDQPMPRLGRAMTAADQRCASTPAGDSG